MMMLVRCRDIALNPVLGFTALGVTYHGTDRRDICNLLYNFPFQSAAEDNKIS
jgi:hypothetical protein